MSNPEVDCAIHLFCAWRMPAKDRRTHRLNSIRGREASRSKLINPKINYLAKFWNVCLSLSSLVRKIQYPVEFDGNGGWKSEHIKRTNAVNGKSLCVCVNGWVVKWVSYDETGSGRHLCWPEDDKKSLRPLPSVVYTPTRFHSKKSVQKNPRGSDDEVKRDLDNTINFRWSLLSMCKHVRRKSVLWSGTSGQVIKRETEAENECAFRKVDDNFCEHAKKKRKKPSSGESESKWQLMCSIEFSKEKPCSPCVRVWEEKQIRCLTLPWFVAKMIF